jgi:hypothetical protein
MIIFKSVKLALQFQEFFWDVVDLVNFLEGLIRCSGFIVRSSEYRIKDRGSRSEERGSSIKSSEFGVQSSE